MSTIAYSSSNIRNSRCIRQLFLTMMAVVAPGIASGAAETGCPRVADLALAACRFAASDDYFTAAGVCENLPETQDRLECAREARETRREDLQTCAEQHDARLELCALLGENRYAPEFDPADFVDPDDIGDTVAPNPYFPLIAGNEWVYETGEQVNRVVVTDKVKNIDGVLCRVVQDVVSINGAPLEDTNDWVAQDVAGNIWYCGEESKDYVIYAGDIPQEPELVSIDGSFKAGRDGALPGILMLAAPVVGDAYRQEFDLGNAEDAAEIISLTATETVPAAGCTGSCLVSREFSPLEQGTEEMKYYAPSIGLILVVADDGTREELVSFTPGD